MKDRLFTILLLGVLLIGITGCGNNGLKATIIDKNGSSIELTKADLEKIYNDNSATFNKTYDHATITLNATIIGIEGDDCSACSNKYYTIYLKGTWKVVIPYEMEDDVSKLKKGNTISITGSIRRTEKDGVYIYSEEFEKKSD